MPTELESKISIGAPLEGEWMFLRPPGHHPYAFDFVKTGQNNKTHNKNVFHFIFNKIPSKNYYAWSQPIISPVDGEVIRVGESWHDHEYTNLRNTIKIWYNATFRFRPKKEDGFPDIRPNAGNHVMIKSDKGYIVFLAHLKNNSVSVKKGQRVVEGEQLGLVGNSGNSTAPHLHINLFDQMDDPFTAKVLPFVFRSYQEQTGKATWVDCALSVPKPGSSIKFPVKMPGG